MQELNCWTRRPGPPLIEALDDIKRLIKTFWTFGGPGDEGSSNGAPSLDDGDYPKDN